MPSRPRYRRDWLIAAGSVIPVFGVAFPFYLAWRDDRRRWVAACAVLVVVAVACFPLSDAGDTIDGATILAVWLSGMAAAIVLASTVAPEDRRASAADLAARRHAVHRTRKLTRGLAAAGIDPQDARPRGGTALTEPIVVVDGVHRGAYDLRDRDDHELGRLEPVERCPPAFRARYELLAPDGAVVLALHIAERSGGHADVILDADDTELVRLRPIHPGDEPRAPRTRRPRPLERLGLRSRWLMSGEGRIGQLHRSEHRRPRMHVITDTGGVEVARVCRVVGGAGPSGTDRQFIIDVADGVDHRVRATAVLAGVLWDYSIISWDAGG